MEAGRLKRIARRSPAHLIAAGKVANLVLLDSDPLAEFRNTQRIAAVVLRGWLFQRGDLTGQLETVAAMPDRRANDWLR